jgi:hypothetical protein
MPTSEIQDNEYAQVIVSLLLDLLYIGLRIHLTKLRGKYTKWYYILVNKDENNNLTPKEILGKYPHYLELITEI